MAVCAFGATDAGKVREASMPFASCLHVRSYRCDGKRARLFGVYGLFALSGPPMRMRCMRLVCRLRAVCTFGATGADGIA